jgi:hypothetical protein
MRCCLALFAAIVSLASCATPPREAFTGGSPYGGAAVDIGRNASGETCTQQPRASGNAVDIFCGRWQQPSGSVAKLVPRVIDYAGNFRIDGSAPQ